MLLHSEVLFPVLLYPCKYYFFTGGRIALFGVFVWMLCNIPFPLALYSRMQSTGWRNLYIMNKKRMLLYFNTNKIPGHIFSLVHIWIYICSNYNEGQYFLYQSLKNIQKVLTAFFEQILPHIMYFVLYIF